jgi:hypothetical protein
MRWFRDNVGRGSWFALLALAINLGVSFGHVHAIEACGNHGLTSAVAAVVSHDERTRGHHDHGKIDYFCPICAASAAMASSLVSAPPALPVEFAGITLDRSVASVLAVAQPPRAAFQSRGPPVS